MSKYIGKVRTRDNKVKNVEVQAKDADSAKRHIKRAGRVVSVKKKVSFNMGGGLSPADRQIFYTRLSSMLLSRVGTSEALDLIRTSFDSRIQEVAGRLYNYVELGDDLATAFERVGAPDFPDASIALIKAGSRSGETWRAIKDAARFEYELHTVNKGASKGLITGVGAFIGAGVMTIGSTLYVGPVIMESDLIKAANKNGAVNIDWINDIAYATGYIMVFLMVAGLLLWLLASVGRQISPVQADKAIMKIPFYKDLVLAKNNFIVLYGLSLLIKSGVRTEEALRLSSQTAPKGALKAELLNAVTAVKSGKPWPKVMDSFHPTDKAALLSAVDREQIGNTLDTLATQYRELYAQRLAAFVPIVNLLAALFLSIAGGLLFGQSIMPMLMATEGLL